MATNLHALIRYRTIDRCVRDRSQAWDWKRLAEECELTINDEMGIDCELSRRTIMYDIANMKDGLLGYYAPIEYNRQRKSYEYTDTNFSISQAPLSGKTLEELDQVLLILRQFSGQEKLMGMGSVIAKLEHGLNIQRDDEAEPLIYFEHGLNAPGQKWLDIMYQHTKKEECLSIKYQAFGKDISHHTVSPYILKEYNNRWYLFCFNHDNEYIQNLALDRVLEVRLSLKPFYRVKDFNPGVLFNDIVGVTLPEGGKVTRILVEAYGTQANYILTKPLHMSQRVHKEKKKSIVFSYDLIPNFEFESKILTYADYVKVLKPVDLRNRVAARLITAAMAYAGDIEATEKKGPDAEKKQKRSKGKTSIDGKLKSENKKPAGKVKKKTKIRRADKKVKKRPKNAGKTSSKKSKLSKRKMKIQGKKKK